MNRFVILPMLLASVSSAGAQPVTIAPGNGFEVERYVLTLRPDLATTAVAGTETIDAGQLTQSAVCVQSAITFRLAA